MAVKSITGTVRSTSLEQNLGRTILGEYGPQIDNIILRDFQSQGENVAVPTLGFLSEELNGLQQKLVDMYNGYMGLYDGVQDIPDTVKISQGALLDGLCFGYDVEKDDFALYTMNFNLLNIMGNTGINMGKQCIEKNIKGEVKGYRIDVEYSVNSDSFNFKAVNHRKVISDSEKDVILIPYIVVLRMMKIIESFLSGGSVLKAVQLIGSSEKTRCITKNTKVLELFSDSPEAIKNVGSSFFPLRGFFYAPVVGAPSTTSMVTNINIFNLSELRVLNKVNQIKQMGIEKAENPVRSIIIDNVISSILLKLSVDNPSKLSEIMEMLPESKLWKRLDYFDGNLNGAMVTKYLHSIGKKDIEEVLNIVPGAREEIERKEKVFSGSAKKLENFDNLIEVLKNHVCRFIIRKKDCSLSSCVCTNSSKILREIYGKDYFKKYEGFGVRIYEVMEEYNCGRDLKESLVDNGFELSNEYVEGIRNILESSIHTDKSKKEIAELLGYKTRSSSSVGNNIMVRTLSAYITENGVEDYYRYVDEDKIIDAIILG